MKTNNYFLVFVMCIFAVVYTCEGHTVNLDGDSDFDSDSIKNDIPNGFKWLSIPKSRLVLNPAGSNCFKRIPITADLPLNIGYYIGKEPKREYNVVNLSYTGNDLQKKRDILPFSCEIKFDKSTIKKCIADNSEIKLEGGSLKLTSKGEKDPWGIITYRIKMPFIPKSGDLKLDIAKSEGSWALKVNNGSMVDTPLEHLSLNNGGIYSLDNFFLNNDKDFIDIRVFALNPAEPVYIKGISFKASAYAPRLKTQTAESIWWPYKFVSTSEPEELSARFKSCDFFYDENTIVRIFSCDSEKTSKIGGNVSLTGKHSANAFAQEKSTVVFTHNDYFKTISFGLTHGTKQRVEPLLRNASISKFDWLVNIPEIEQRDVVVSIAYATKNEGVDLAIKRSRQIYIDYSLEKIINVRKKQWDKILAKVPAPEQFGIKVVDNKGSSPQMHRVYYYGAWVFLVSNILPMMPEAGILYYQTPAGKPSLWLEGEPGAPASCSWDSFLSQQYLAMIYPEISTSAFEIIIDAIDETGKLEGESLPSEKARTAWILYLNNNDIEFLKRVYEPVKRYLIWREKNPRWIHKIHNELSQKDSHFMDHLLNDIDYAVKMAKELGFDEDLPMWRELREKALKNYCTWFFFDDGRLPVEYFDVKTNEHNPGNPNWICSGLYIKDLPVKYRNDLLKLYSKLHDPSQDLCGLEWCKYGTVSYLVHGLINNNQMKKSLELLNCLLRDQIRAGDFSESYVRPSVVKEKNLIPSDFSESKGTDVFVSGVRPSLFGAVQMIDFTLLNNGLRLDNGFPRNVDWSLE